MPKYSVEVPGRGVYTVESDRPLSNSQQYLAVLDSLREAPAPVAPPPPKASLVGSGIGALERQISGLRTGAESLFGSPEAAAQRGIARGEEIGKQYASGTSLERVKKAYEQSGLLSAAGEAVSQVPYAIAEQLPRLAGTYLTAKGGAAAGAALGTAIAPGVGTALGSIVGGGVGVVAPSMLEFFGTGIERQAEEDKKAGRPVEIDRGKAAAAALPSAAADVAAMAIPFGRGVVAKVLNVPAKQLINRSEAQVMKLAEERLAATLAKGVGVGVLAEVPTEVGQQMLERWQAGLPLTNNEAMQEYTNAAYGATLVSPLGGAGRYVQRGQAQTEAADIQAKRTAEEAKARADAERAAAEARGDFDPQQVNQRRVGLAQQIDGLQAQLQQAAALRDTDTVATLAPQLRALRGELGSANELAKNLGLPEMSTIKETEKKLKTVESQLAKLNTSLQAATAEGDEAKVEAILGKMEALKTRDSELRETGRLLGLDTRTPQERAAEQEAIEQEQAGAIGLEQDLATFGAVQQDQQRRAAQAVEREQEDIASQLAGMAGQEQAAAQLEPFRQAPTEAAYNQRRGQLNTALEDIQERMKQAAEQRDDTSLAKLMNDAKRTRAEIGQIDAAAAQQGFSLAPSRQELTGQFDRANKSVETLYKQLQKLTDLGDDAAAEPVFAKLTAAKQKVAQLQQTGQALGFDLLTPEQKAQRLEQAGEQGAREEREATAERMQGVGAAEAQFYGDVAQTEQRSLQRVEQETAPRVLTGPALAKLGIEDPQEQALFESSVKSGEVTPQVTSTLGLPANASIADIDKRISALDAQRQSAQLTDQFGRLTPEGEQVMQNEVVLRNLWELRRGMQETAKSAETATADKLMSTMDEAQRGRFIVPATPDATPAQREQIKVDAQKRQDSLLLKLMGLAQRISRLEPTSMKQDRTVEGKPRERYLPADSLIARSTRRVVEKQMLEARDEYLNLLLKQLAEDRAVQGRPGVTEEDLLRTLPTKAVLDEIIQRSLAPSARSVVDPMGVQERQVAKIVPTTNVDYDALLKRAAEIQPLLRSTYRSLQDPKTTARQRDLLIQEDSNLVNELAAIRAQLTAKPEYETQLRTVEGRARDTRPLTQRPFGRVDAALDVLIDELETARQRVVPRVVDRAATEKEARRIESLLKQLDERTQMRVGVQAGQKAVTYAQRREQLQNRLSQLRAMLAQEEKRTAPAVPKERPPLSEQRSLFAAADMPPARKAGQERAEQPAPKDVRVEAADAVTAVLEGSPSPGAPGATRVRDPYQRGKELPAASRRLLEQVRDFLNDRIETENEGGKKFAQLVLDEIGADARRGYSDLAPDSIRTLGDALASERSARVGAEQTLSQRTLFKELDEQVGLFRANPRNFLQAAATKLREWKTARLKAQKKLAAIDAKLEKTLVAWRQAQVKAAGKVVAVRRQLALQLDLVDQQIKAVDELLTLDRNGREIERSLNISLDFQRRRAASIEAAQEQAAAEGMVGSELLAEEFAQQPAAQRKSLAAQKRAAAAEGMVGSDLLAQEFSQQAASQRKNLAALEQTATAEGMVGSDLLAERLPGKAAAQASIAAQRRAEAASLEAAQARAEAEGMSPSEVRIQAWQEKLRRELEQELDRAVNEGMADNAEYLAAAQARRAELQETALREEKALGLEIDRAAGEGMGTAVRSRTASLLELADAGLLAQRRALLDKRAGIVERFAKLENTLEATRQQIANTPPQLVVDMQLEQQRLERQIQVERGQAAAQKAAEQRTIEERSKKNALDHQAMMERLGALPGKRVTQQPVYGRGYSSAEERPTRRVTEAVGGAKGARRTPVELRGETPLAVVFPMNVRTKTGQIVERMVEVPVVQAVVKSGARIGEPIEGKYVPKMVIKNEAIKAKFDRVLKAQGKDAVVPAGSVPNTMSAIPTAERAEQATLKAQARADRPRPASSGVLRSGVPLERRLQEVTDYNADTHDFRIGEVGGGIDTAAASQRVNAVRNALPADVNFQYYETADSLPASIRRAIAAQGVDPATVRGGVTPKGEVFVVGGNHTDMADLERTIAHELKGHYGFEGFVGEQGMNRLLAGVEKAHGGVLDLARTLGVEEQARGAVQEARNAGLDERGQRLKALKEIIAYTEEARVDASFMKRAKTFVQEMVGAVRSALKRYGLADASKMSTSDLFYLMRESRKNFEANMPLAKVTDDGTVSFRAVKPVYSANVPDVLRNPESKLVAQQRSTVDQLRASTTGMSTKWLRARQAAVDRAASLEEVGERGKKAGLLDSVKAMDLTYFVRIHDNRNVATAEVVTNGPLSLQTGANGEVMVKSQKGVSLKAIAEALKGAGVGNETATNTLFTKYLLAERALGVDGVGLSKLNFAKDFDATELKAALEFGRNNPAFQEARKLYKAYNVGLIDFAVQTGAISKADAAGYKKGDYVPYYRANADGSVDLYLTNEKPLRIGNLKEQPYLQELVGGDEPIFDFFTSSLQNTAMLTDMALRNLATRNVGFTLQSLGIAQRVGPKVTGKDIIRAKIDGVEQAWRIDTAKQQDLFGDIPSELIVKGLEGMTGTIPAAFKLLGLPGSMLRKFVTRDPRYAVRQVVRDSVSGLFLSGANYSPVTSALGQMASIVKGTNKTEQTLQSNLVLGGQVISGMPDDMQKILLQIAGGKPGWSTAMAKLDSWAMAGDAATRVNMYNSFIKQGLSEREATIATLESMNFSKRGTSPSVYMANTLLPFFNAQLVGLDVLYKALMGKATAQEKLQVKQKLLKRGAMLAIMTIAYAGMMEGDEAYENATPEQRLSNWFVRVPGMAEPLRVPIPFEAGFMFKALPEALMHKLKDDPKSEQAAKGLKSLVMGMVPGASSYFIPQGMKPVIEIAMNKSLYNGAPIVSPKLEGLEPAQQFDERSSGLAKMLGEAGAAFGIGVSPKQVDYLINGYFAGLGMGLVRLPDMMMSAGVPKPTQRVSELPIVGGLFQPNDAGGVLQLAFEDGKAFERAGQTYKRLAATDPAKAEQFAEKYAAELALASEGGRLRQQIGKINAAMAVIRMDPDMSGPEKRAQLNELRQLELQIARQSTTLSAETKRLVAQP